MLKRYVTTVIASLAILLLSQGGAASGLSPVGPVVNGDFELPIIPNPVYQALEDAGWDTCIGIGHQVFYGSDSWQHKLVDEGDPQGAVNQTAEDPEGEAKKAAGYDHCVADGRDGNDLVWFNPAGQADKASGWSSIDAEFGRHFDDDPFDREVRIGANGSHSSHNLWQSFASPSQAFSANFDSFDFRVEAGSIAPSANIQIGLSLSPSYMQHPFIGAFHEGAVLFRAPAMVPGADGLVSLDPTTNTTISCAGGYTPCLEFRADFDAADAEGKRVLLGQARVVQMSFWNFNRGAEHVVIDDVAMVGATTLAEEAGNVNPNPGV